MTSPQHTLAHRLTITEIAPWFTDMAAVIKEVYEAHSDQYKDDDDPPQWWSRISCLHEEIQEEMK